ncbi:unnamed protein product [Protopolystoma xenopodis]|uniref:Uncharacterized protein n=1 Tax=Protopolystoma xenopodis TaxID=117903 RepID=A0A448X5Q2_9PLAT|nr:unnamed protein product [Protopolystoma xenopodis]
MRICQLQGLSFLSAAFALSRPSFTFVGNFGPVLPTIIKVGRGQDDVQYLHQKDMAPLLSPTKGTYWTSPAALIRGLAVVGIVPMASSRMLGSHIWSRKDAVWWVTI